MWQNRTWFYFLTEPSSTYKHCTGTSCHIPKFFDTFLCFTKNNNKCFRFRLLSGLWLPCCQPWSQILPPSGSWIKPSDWLILICKASDWSQTQPRLPTMVTDPATVWLLDKAFWLVDTYLQGFWLVTDSTTSANHGHRSGHRLAPG